MLCCVWCPRMLQVRRHQPFLLDMWRALSGVTSGIWETVHMEEEFDLPELLVHLAPWQSGLEAVDLTRSLIQDNMSAGYAFVLEGGEPEARRRWGKLVASGKLGVVRAPGKKPRLIGDGSVSGANRASRIHEHVRYASSTGEILGSFLF